MIEYLILTKAPIYIDTLMLICSSISGTSLRLDIICKILNSYSIKTARQIWSLLKEAKYRYYIDYNTIKNVLKMDYPTRYILLQKRFFISHYMN
jgi:hypothetical protein